MKYLGSKNKLAKHILPIILKNRKKGQYYVEPFVGGANLIDKVSGNRMGNDSNEYIIALLKALQNGWSPPKYITKEEYNRVKNNRAKYPKEHVGYFATQLVFGGIWFGSFRRDNTGKRMYDIEAYNNVMKQVPNLKGIDFYCGDYKDFYIPNNSIIYCDPPYKGARPYIGGNKIQHSEFWEWCRNLAKCGHTVYVSEYNAPIDFTCVWEKIVKVSGNNITAKKPQDSIEKLFTYNI